MKRLIEKIEDAFADVALAEGEGIGAAGYAAKPSTSEGNLAAVAFAEAGDFEDAREILEEQQKRKRNLKYIKEHPLQPDDCQYGEVCYEEAS
ncbi:MAG TPA: hypothetical protein DCO77_07125 [Nitrospiraceae bacterium]|nr:hypothetical protein [Nitrospiraceae bacterium]